MKGDFSEVLIPTVVAQGDHRQLYNLPTQKRSHEGQFQRLKWLAIIALSLTCCLTILTTFVVIRYERRMVHYETRVTELETDLETFFQILSEELEYDHRGKQTQNQNQFADQEHQTPSGDVIPGINVSGQFQSRKKRQIQFPNIPNSFGPDVERTEDGVPIVERSYQISSASSSNTQRQHYAPLRVAPPTPDSEGLRLYEGLVETGGRNEPKSLDFAPRDGDGLLPHHKVSAAWSEKESAQPRSGLQLRSGDGLGYGVDDSRSGGPRFANELTYTRSSSFRTSRPRPRPSPRPQTSSSRLQQPQNSNVFVTSGQGGSGATYHRNSRVAATGDHYYSNTRKTSQPRNRNSGVEYPPLRRLPLGDGEGEVIARVVQTNDDDGSQSHAPRRLGRRGERKSGINRRERQPEYLSRRPVETYRPPVSTTESSAGFTEGGELNLSIRKSAPFGTYYSSARGNWEINTPPPQRYRNSY